MLDIPSNTFNIVDMGLAVSAPSFLLTRTGQTLWYRAPEVLLGIKHCTLRQTTFDMWSFAVLMCALLSGMHVFSANLGELKPTSIEAEAKVPRTQLDFMGPSPYPGMKQLPQWPQFAPLLKLESSGVSAGVPSLLASPTVVRRAVCLTDVAFVG